MSRPRQRLAAREGLSAASLWAVAIWRCSTCLSSPGPIHGRGPEEDEQEEAEEEREGQQHFLEPLPPFLHHRHLASFPAARPVCDEKKGTGGPRPSQ